jgi:hypothetical protein
MKLVTPAGLSNRAGKMLPQAAVMTEHTDQPSVDGSPLKTQPSIVSPISATGSMKRVGCQPLPLPTSISFEGCGAAISYHLGVIESLYQTYGKDTLLNSNIKFMGTSSGSIAALVVALGMDVARWKDRMFTAWEPMGFFFQADRYVGNILSEILLEAGDEAFHRLENRLFISITKFFSRNFVISKWDSNSDVKRTVLASCFIPVVMLRPIWVGHCFAVDGGFSNNYPRLEGKQTVLVSPSRSAGSEIKPELKLRFRDLIGAPKRDRFYELWTVGIENGLDYFQPAVEHRPRAGADAPQPVQTACGRCYFWAMRQSCCMCSRLFLFWIILFSQVWTIRSADLAVLPLTPVGAGAVPAALLRMLVPHLRGRPRGVAEAGGRHGLQPHLPEVRLGPRPRCGAGDRSVGRGAGGLTRLRIIASTACEYSTAPCSSGLSFYPGRSIVYPSGASVGN